MAVSVVLSIAEGVLLKLGNHVVQNIGLALGVKSELQNLEDTMKSIKALFLKADEQENKDRAVIGWLEKLEYVCQDVDNILDEFSIVNLQRQLIKQGSSVKQVRKFISYSSLKFRFSMGHRIKDIREELNRIYEDRVRYNLPLAERIVNIRVGEGEVKNNSLFDPSYFIGRLQEKEDVVRMLMDDSGPQSSVGPKNSVGVIPIVGIGGMGKSTLARMVYTDERVIGYFEPRIWLGGVNKQRLIEKIIKSDSNTCFVDLNIDEWLKDKRFLLVLDDVWHHNDETTFNHDEWHKISNLLKGGANGSKIIVTTRSPRIAEVVCTMRKYELQGLLPDDCLQLFVRCAFKVGEEGRHDNLMRIGEEIVNKCHGVPLAIKSLGSTLAFSRDESHWSSFIREEIWKIENVEVDIFTSLRLSYNELSHSLKQCFAYCSNFPKDHEFDNIYLIYRWMAQGLIQSSDKAQELEKIGERHFHDLSGMGFFIDVKDYGYFLTFKMHDLFRKLALSVADRQERHNPDNFARTNPEKIRELPFLNGEPFLQEQLPCIRKFKGLRVLDLTHVPFEALPSSIGDLKHLRFLDLSRNDNIKLIPNSLCKLLLLQTLKLQDCGGLMKLPRDFRNLVNLRCLWLTTQERCLPSKGIGSLLSLQFLFIKGCPNLESLFDDEGDIGVLQWLSTVRTLSIDDCRSLLSLPWGLRLLTALENLIIVNCEQLDLNTDDDGNGEDNYETIQAGGGLRSLQYLGIRCLHKLIKLPQWLLQGAANALKFIVIEDCDNFTTLPEDLTCLRKLWILQCPQLTSLPEGINHHSTLREVRIDECPELIRRCQQKTEEWKKISRVTDVYLDGIKIQDSSDNQSVRRLGSAKSEGGEIRLATSFLDAALKPSSSHS